MRGVLVDASALVALLDFDDVNHGRVVETLKTIRDPLITIWPALTEAMHLVGDSFRAQEALCDMVTDGVLSLAQVEGAEMPRVKALMAKYHDLPMDFADAILIRVAERDRLTRIVTFDRHFAIYRLARRTKMVVL